MVAATRSVGWSSTTTPTSSRSGPRPMCFRACSSRWCRRRSREKNRLHLDFRPADRDAEVDRLLALGADPGRRRARRGVVVSCSPTPKATSSASSRRGSSSAAENGLNWCRQWRGAGAMSLPKVVSHDEWLAARKALLAEEKAMTKAATRSTPSAASCRWSRSTRTTSFEGPDGTVGLLDLFDGRRQLIVQHFMFDPSWDDGCPSCTAGADEISAGLLDHLHARDTTLRRRVARAAREDRAATRRSGAGPSLGTRRTAATSTTTSTSPSTRRSRRSSSTSATRTSSRRTAWLARGDSHRSSRATAASSRRRRRVPHLFGVRPRHRVVRRLVLLPRPHRARPPGGVGGAQGPRRRRPRRSPDFST